MSGKESLRPKHYSKSCYLIHRISEKMEKDLACLPESTFIYPFAMEYNSNNLFFDAYLPCDGLYNNEPLFRTLSLPVSASGIRAIWSEKAAKEIICAKCPDASECEYTDYLQKRRCFCIRIKNLRNTCSKCGKPVYINKEKEIAIHDVRLMGYPVLMRINRVREYCSNCEILQGDDQIQYIQAFCNSVLTPRLAKSVLQAYASGVKRSFITEAYAISASQVNRIKKRMIELTRARVAHSAIEKLASLDMSLYPEIDSVRFTDICQTEYYAYFSSGKGYPTELVSLLTKTRHDCVISYYTGQESCPTKLFDDESDWMIASFVVLLGDLKLPRDAVLSLLKRSYRSFLGKKYGRLDSAFFSSFSESMGRSRLFLFFRDDQNFDFENLDLSENTIGDVKPCLENGQYVLDEFYVNVDRVSTFDRPAAVSEFISILSPYLNSTRRQRYPNVLFDRLLYFNPIAISAIELHWYTGERFRGVDLHGLREQYESMVPQRWGVPVHCLSHLIQSGLLQNNQDTLLSCYSVSSDMNDADSTPDEKHLPCGLSHGYCVHCHEVF